MKKADKEKITKTMNNIVTPYGGKFRFRRADDVEQHEGWFDIKKNTIVVKANGETYDTICHELAHMVQYHKTGDTKCGNCPMGQEHRKMQEGWEEDLALIGVKKMVRNALGIVSYAERMEI